MISISNWQVDVIESKIPVLVDFWAEWCYPCKILESVIKELSIEFDGKIKFCKINVEENKELVEKFVIRSVPFLLVIKDGIIQEEIMGSVKKDILKDKLDKVISKS